MNFHTMHGIIGDYFIELVFLPHTLNDINYRQFENTISIIRRRSYYTDYTDYKYQIWFMHALIAYSKVSKNKNYNNR